MDRTREAYRQQMIGQLQLWEGEIARLKADAELLEPDARFVARMRLRELDRRHREVFGRYGDLLLAGEDQWDQTQIALESAADSVREILDEFTSQPA